MDTLLPLNLTVLWESVSSAVSDWRVWFVTVLTWIIVHRVKVLWDHFPRRTQNRTSEGASFIVACFMAFWIFKDHPRVYEIALSLGLLNPYLYKFAVGAVGHYRPDWVKWLRSKKYHVEEGDDGMLLVREDSEKTIRLSSDDLKKYRAEKDNTLQ